MSNDCLINNNSRLSDCRIRCNFVLTKFIFCDNDKLVIALQPHAIWEAFSSLLVFCCYFTRLKRLVKQIAKYKKVWKYLSYCTWHRVIIKYLPVFEKKSNIRYYFWRLSGKPFVPNAPFLYPLKISENLAVFCCCQGVEKGCIGNNWVNSVIRFILFIWIVLSSDTYFNLFVLSWDKFYYW